MWEINGILYAWRWNSFNRITGKISQNNLLNSCPSLIKVHIFDRQEFPCTAHTCTVEFQNKTKDQFFEIWFWNFLNFWVFLFYLNKRSSISGNERYSSSTKSTNDERVVFKTRKFFNPLMMVGCISEKIETYILLKREWNRRNVLPMSDNSLLFSKKKQHCNYKFNVLFEGLNGVTRCETA